MSRKEREIEQRKEYILQIAEKLFPTQGYDETTMDQIAQLSEFSKGTVYKYFLSKDEIYLTFGIQAYQMIIEKTKEFIEKAETGISQLIAVGKAYYEFFKESPGFAMIFHHIGDMLPDIDKIPINERTPNEKAYIEYNNAYRDLFVGVITEAIKTKNLRTDKEPLMIGLTLATLTSGMIKELARREDIISRLKLDIDSIVDFVFEMLAEGLQPR